LFHPKLGLGASLRIGADPAIRVEPHRKLAIRGSDTFGLGHW
jgi:hypothetical protein